MKHRRDYLLVISPSKAVAGKVLNHKVFCEHLIGDFESRHSKAHITVANYFDKITSW